METARCKALQGYDILSGLLLAKAKYRYQVVLKMHKYDELLRKSIATGRNPMNGWTMSDEDWIGKMSSLGASCHSNTLGLRCIQRFMVHWFNGLNSDNSAFV